VFGCDIEHADNLGIAFEAAGVPATVLHSRSETRRDEVLADFRKAKGPAVLVSVGMLLEGVDIPDARTAFLTRPTASRILMRQMIGRVLRGEAGGGEALAHVVDLRDRWTDDVDILAPVEVPGIPAVATGDEDGRGEHRLPPVRDELTDEPLGEDILRRIERAYEELRVGLPHSSALTSTELVGFYELGHLNVPVFDHARDRWTELLRSELGGGDSSLRSPLDLFDDLPVPRPVRADIREVVNFCRSHQVEPPLVEVRSTFSVRAIGIEILDAGPMTEAQKAAHLRESYERTLARSAFFSFQQFYEAVQQEILALTGVTGNLANPESPRSVGAKTQAQLPRLTRRTDRSLEPLFMSSVRRGRELLASEDAEYADLLRRENLPKCDWTLRPAKGTWAYWTARLAGQSRGQVVIRINRVLQAPRTQISDELLEYLLWHELCHHLLPGRGHDSEFRRLESLWPDFSRLDHELDTLHERFDLGWGT
jgi:hypothetical protein